MADAPAPGPGIEPSSIRPVTSDAGTGTAPADAARVVGATEGAAADVAVPLAAARLAPPVSGPGRRRRSVLVWLAAVWLAVVVLAALTAPWLPVPDPEEQDLGNRLARPLSEGHLLGTDGLGRDVLSRLAHGARVSLVIGLAAVSIGMLVGGTIGMVVGYVRGWVEAVTVWALDVVLAFPGLVLLLALVAYVGQSLLTITLVIGFLSVPTYARVARATTLVVAQREYVLAARALGATRRRILAGEILPNVVLPVAAFGLVALGVVIVLEGSLAFLGLSVEAPDPTWGSMIAEGRRHLDATTHLSLIPSMVMFLTVLAVNYVGDSLRTRFDVKGSSL
jgi:peptide/nickel transport system permease protein